MNTTTLTFVFQQSQNDLKRALQEICLPKDYQELQKIINNHIQKLLTSDNDFSKLLNASDAEILTHALRMALSFQKLSITDSIDFKALSIQTEYDKGDKGQSNGDKQIINEALSLLPTIICAFIDPWLAIVAGIGTIGYKKIKIIEKKGKKYLVNIQEIKHDISRKITDKEIQKIISGIESLCSEIDDIISKIQRDRKDLIAQFNNKLDDCVLEKKYPQILASLQYLFMEDIKSETKNQYVQNILFSIQSYGYEVVEYSPLNSGFFIKKINPNVNEETMYLPAIIKEVQGIKIVAAEGVVYIPEN